MKLLTSLTLLLLLNACQTPLHSVNGKDVDPPSGHVFRCFTPPTPTDPKPDCVNP